MRLFQFIRNFPFLGPVLARVLAVTALSAPLACTPLPLAEPVSQAQVVSKSPAAVEAKEHAPSAFGAAEKLRAEALFLHQEKRYDESEAAGEQALAAYEQAFALARLARAEERLRQAQQQAADAQKRLDELDTLQARISQDAERFELQARVHLDRQEVEDVDQLSPERARARRTIALRLAADARMLCRAATLLEHDQEALASLDGKLAALDADLSTGSVRKDMFPRASSLRSACLTELTRARRPKVESNPESHESDALLEALSARGEWMVYRDDRGVVVSVGKPLERDGTLSESARESFSFLGKVAKNHDSFPVMLALHTAKSRDARAEETMGKLAEETMRESGAPQVSRLSVSNAQPAVFSSARGADEQNERVEVIFVHRGR